MAGGAGRLEWLRTSSESFYSNYSAFSKPKGPSRTKKTIRKILVSVKILSAILGPEMAAPILWTPGKKRPFCRKNHVHKISRFRGGYFGFFGGGSTDFIFMDARIFLRLRRVNSVQRLSQMALQRCNVNFFARFLG